MITIDIRTIGKLCFRKGIIHFQLSVYIFIISLFVVGRAHTSVPRPADVSILSFTEILHWWFYREKQKRGESTSTWKAIHSALQKNEMHMKTNREHEHTHTHTPTAHCMRFSDTQKAQHVSLYVSNENAGDWNATMTTTTAHKEATMCNEKWSIDLIMK